jgi:hypothetical protein
MIRPSVTDVKKKALAALNRVRPGSKPSSNTTRNAVIAVAILAPIAAAGGYVLSRVLRNRKTTQDVDSGYDGLPTAIATSRIGDVPDGTFVVTTPLPDEDTTAGDKLTDDNK